MSKKVAISAIVIVVAVAIAIGIYQYDASKKEKISSFEECVDEGNLVMESYPRMCRTEDGRLFIEEIKDIVEDDVSFDGVIEVDNPKYNGTVSSPLDIRGKAKGTWFFEGSFSGRVVDKWSDDFRIYSASRKRVDDGRACTV